MAPESPPDVSARPAPEGGGPRHRRRNPGSLPHGLAATGALLLALSGTLLWLSLLTGPWRLASGLLDARTHLDKAAKRLENTFFKEARYEAYAAAAAVDRARDGLSSGGPLLDLARRVETVDDALGEVPHLLDAAEHSAEAARGTLQIAQGALSGPNQLIVKDPDDEKGGSKILIDRVRSTAEVVSDVRNELRASARALRKVQVSNLPRRARSGVRDGIERAEEAQTLLRDAEAGFALLPGFLGEDGPRNYLFAIQNSAEQRGTGGAILQFKIMTIDNGKPELQEGGERRGSIYNIDKNRQALSIPLPPDAWYVANIVDAQRFGNANWSPDWPLSARLTVAYGHASDALFSGVEFPEIDGVILVDPNAVQELMPGVGRFRTSRSKNYLNAQRIVHFLLYKAYASFPKPWIRRSVLQQVVDGFYKRMLDPRYPTKLLTGFGDALAHKHMQIWMNDPREQRFIEHMEWDGAIDRATKDDYLYVVEQNVGGNKLDYYVTNQIEADITIEGEGSRVVTETTAHNGVFLPQPRFAMGDTGGAVGSVHRPMLNLYVHERAELLGTEVVGTRIDAPPSVATWIGDQPPTHLEKGKKVWSGTLEIPPGADGTLGFEYAVPDVVRTQAGRKVYRLHVQHQPKVRPDTLVIRLRLPAGATRVEAPGWKRDGNALVYERSLREDMVLEVSWQE